MSSLLFSVKLKQQTSEIKRHFDFRSNSFELRHHTMVHTTSLLTHILLISAKSALFLMESFITCRDNSRNRNKRSGSMLKIINSRFTEKCSEELPDRLCSPVYDGLCRLYLRSGVRLAAACGKRGRTSSRAPHCWTGEAG